MGPLVVGMEGDTVGPFSLLADPRPETVDLVTAQGRVFLAPAQGRTVLTARSRSQLRRQAGARSLRDGQTDDR